MQAPEPRLFTLEQARAILPEVKRSMEEVQRTQRELVVLEPQLWPVMERAAFNGFTPELGDATTLFLELRNAVRALLELGVLVKDLRQGLVDFLSERDGERVFLCWKYGEEELAWWHPLHSGLAGRQPLD